VKIALAQVSSGDNWQSNLRNLKLLTQEAAQQLARAVLFPENVLYMGERTKLWNVAKALLEQEVLWQVSDLAQTNQIAILVGGYPELIKGSQKVYNTSVWINEQGKELARYRKIHLFDVVTPNGEKHRESDRFMPGEKIVTFQWHDIHIGLSICFDLRFPEQFRKMAKKGAEWLLVPSAFTCETGQAHWHTLLRARAIENLATLLAPAQTGTHSTGRKTYGHSLVVGPWGDILCDVGQKPRLKTIQVPLKEIRDLRKTFSVF